MFSTRADSYKIHEFLRWNSNITVHQANGLHELRPCRDMDDYRTATDTMHEELTNNGFDYVARNYILDGAEKHVSFSYACKHNSKVALKAGMPVVARTWLMLLELYDLDVSLVASTASTAATAASSSLMNNSSQQQQQHQQQQQQQQISSKPGSTHGAISRTHSDAAYIERTKRGSGDKESKRSSIVVTQKVSGGGVAV